MPLLPLLTFTSHPFPILPFTTTNRAHRRDLVIVNGGGPRTYPGGVTKWQWKRMQASKSKQLLKARLARERQLYEMRKRAELQAAVADLELPWEAVAEAPTLLSASADDQVKALADRFHRPGGLDMWNERDGPQVFVSPDGVSSARFFPKNAVHSVRPYQIERRMEDGVRRQGVCRNGDDEEELSGSGNLADDDVSYGRRRPRNGKNGHKERGRGREGGDQRLNGSRSQRPGNAMNGSGEYGKIPKERMGERRFDGAVHAMNEHEDDGSNVRSDRRGGRRYNRAVNGINGGEEDGNNVERYRKDIMGERRYNGMVGARNADGEDGEKVRRYQNKGMAGRRFNGVPRNAHGEDGDKVRRYQSNGMGDRRFNGVPGNADGEDGGKVRRYESNGMGGRRFNGVPRNADGEDGDKVRRYQSNRMGDRGFNGAASAVNAGKEGRSNFSSYRNDRMREKRYSGVADDMNVGDEDGDSFARHRNNQMGRRRYNEDDDVKGDEEDGDNVGRWKNSKVASKSSGRGSMNRRRNEPTSWKPDDARSAIDDTDDNIAVSYHMDHRRDDSTNYGKEHYQKNRMVGGRFDGVARNILRPTSKFYAEEQT